MGVATLEVKIGRCLNMRQPTFLRCMSAVAASCNRARNSVVRNWIRWREDNPDYQPGQLRTKDGKLKFKRSGDPDPEPLWCSQDAINGLYTLAREVSPEVSSTVINQCHREVVSDLNDDVPYHHEGPSKVRWQAVFAHELNASSYTGIVIPVPSQPCRITCSESECTANFPIYSLLSGRKKKRVHVNLLVSQLPRGKRRIVESIATGESRMKDSTVVFKRGHWFLQIAYEQKKDNREFDKGTVATLKVVADMNMHQPFRLHIEGKKAWRIGDGAILAIAHKQVEGRRAALKYRYKFGNGAGHGRKRFFSKLRPHERSYRDVQDMFIKMACADIVKGMIRHKQETLLYREPTKPVREKTWFGQHSIPMNWTKFESFLKHKCNQHGIKVKIERIPMAEWKAEDEKVLVG